MRAIPLRSQSFPSFTCLSNYYCTLRIHSQETLCLPAVDCTALATVRLKNKQSKTYQSDLAFNYCTASMEFKGSGGSTTTAISESGFFCFKQVDNQYNTNTRKCLPSYKNETRTHHRQRSKAFFKHCFSEGGPD